MKRFWEFRRLSQYGVPYQISFNCRKHTRVYVDFDSHGISWHNNWAGQLGPYTLHGYFVWGDFWKRGFRFMHATRKYL